MDGLHVGAHYLAKRLMKEVFNSHPPVPRYAFTWPVDQDIKYLNNLGANENLSLKVM